MNNFNVPLYSKPPISCEIKRQFIFKKPNEHCKWGFEYPHEISKCFTCPNFNKEGFE